MYKPKMKRTNIYLTKLQHKTVTKEAKKRGITVAELIRRLIDLGLGEYHADMGKEKSPTRILEG
jgi:hypothetical protein|tara:strand:- start:4523 stop:4714 length:192 start_codon:yes stop_codon:yes gene_type:complete